MFKFINAQLYSVVGLALLRVIKKLTLLACCMYDCLKLKCYLVISEAISQHPDRYP